MRIVNYRTCALVAVALSLGLFCTLATGLMWRGWSGEEWETPHDLVAEDYYGFPFAWLTWRAILHTDSDSGQGVWIRSELVNIPMLLYDWFAHSVACVLAIYALLWLRLWQRDGAGVTVKEGSV